MLHEMAPVLSAMTVCGNAVMTELPGGQAKRPDCAPVSSTQT